MDYKFYHYSVQNLVLTLDKSYELKTNRFVGFVVINAYMRNQRVATSVSDRMPMCIASLALEAEMVEALFNNTDKAQLALTIAEIEYDSEMVQVGASDFINGTYDIIPVKSVDNYMLPDALSEESTEDSGYQYQNVDVYLYRKTIVNYFNQDISINATDVSKAAVLQSLFKMRSIPSRTVIATPPQDNSVLSNCTLPMNTLIQNIDALNEYYGIYTCKPLVYWDFLLNQMYCINRYNPNITLSSKTDFDTVQFVMESAETPEAVQSGSANSLTDTTHYVALNKTPTIQDTTENKYYTEFSTVTTVDTNSGTVSKTTLDSNSTKDAYLIKTNTFTSAQAINDAIVPKDLVAITVSNASLKMFKPYKTYRFDLDVAYDDLDLNNKKYRLGYFGYEFESNGDAEFTATAELSMYCVGDQYQDS